MDTTDVLGRRIGAGLIDLIVLFVLFVGLGIALGESETSGGEASVRLEGLSFVVWLLVSGLYYGVAESMGGQTLGKRLLGIRVVKADGGGTPGGGAIALRTLLRLVDGLGFYLVGLIFVLATGQKRQRLGDIAAGTSVARA